MHGSLRLSVKGKYGFEVLVDVCGHVDLNSSVADITQSIIHVDIDEQSMGKFVFESVKAASLESTWW